MEVFSKYVQASEHVDIRRYYQNTFQNTQFPMENVAFNYIAKYVKCTALNMNFLSEELSTNFFN